MYHEEKVIKDVLCWRGTPNGEWHKFSDNVLTDRLLTSRNHIEELTSRLTAAEKVIEAAKLAVQWLNNFSSPDGLEEQMSVNKNRAEKILNEAVDEYEAA